VLWSVLLKYDWWTELREEVSQVHALSWGLTYDGGNYSQSVSKLNVDLEVAMSYIDVSFHCLILISFGDGAAGHDGSCFAFGHSVKSWCLKEVLGRLT
jgi:hypothetical protein